MHDEEMSPEDQQAWQELAQAVAQQLSEGREKHAIAEDLTRNRGFEQDQAIEFVESIDFELAQAQSGHHASAGGSRVQRGGGGGGGSGAMGWLIWIGVIVLFNILSYAFNWGWIIY